VLNLILALVLTPELGVEGPAVATAGALLAVFPVLLRVGLRASGVRLSLLLGRAVIPAYTFGAFLGGGLLAVRFGFLEPVSVATVVPLAVVGLAAYWGAYYALVLDPSERELVRGLLRRRALE
jgi:hypothetical protein